MSLWRRLEAIDRRVIFSILAVGIVLPMIFPMHLPIAVTPEVQGVYDRIESLKPGDAILISAEYDPSTLAEIQPMMRTMLHHAFRRGAKVVVVCLLSTGVSLVDETVQQVAREMGKTNGEDWVFLGYKPNAAIVIQAMGQNFRDPFPRDYYGRQTDTLPMMKGLRNYSSLKFVLNISATSSVDYWIQYGSTRYGFPIALAVTAVMATDYYTFLQSKQIFGLIGGMKGAAEYERLMNMKGYATRVMNIQSVVHVLIVGFIMVGNVAYLATGGRMRRGGRA